MSLLKVTQTRYISASIRLTDSTAVQVDQYAAFVHASADNVMERALTYVFAKDKDFQEFIKSPDTKRITPTLRIHRVPAPDAVEQTNSKPAHAAEVGSSVRMLNA